MCSEEKRCFKRHRTLVESEETTIGRKTISSHCAADTANSKNKTNEEIEHFNLDHK